MIRPHQQIAAPYAPVPNATLRVQVIYFINHHDVLALECTYIQIIVCYA